MEKWVFAAENKERFTPVRRRPSTINTRLPHNDLEKEWTAARCNRLLRALKSRVAILNKDLSLLQSNRENVVEVKAATTRKAEDDTDWTQARKRIKKTYSSRGGRVDNSSRANSGSSRMLPTVKETRSFIPGEISVPTPILSRARGELVSRTAPAVQYSEISGQDSKGNKRTRVRDGISSFQLSETLRDIRKQTPASRYTIYEGIYNGLEALLKATIPDEPQKCVGPSSLLSMCLRTVPRYISEEEAILVVHIEETGSRSAINTRDVSTEIYDDLEAFGSVGRGWKHLRDIVRSHGIQVVSDAIIAGSLEVEFTGILVTLCMRRSATKEAEILLSSLLSTVKLPEPKSVFTRFSDELTSRSLSMLWKFVEITGRFSFQYRQLSIMFLDGILPLGWLASKELSPVWTRAIQVLSLDSSEMDALMFLDKMLALLAQSGSQGSEEENVLTIGNGVIFDAMKQTFSSLITTLSSIVILSRETGQDAPTETSTPRGYDHFVTLLRSCLIQWELSNASTIQGTLLVIANIIVGASYHQNPESMNDLTDVLLDQLWQMDSCASISSPYHDIITFICSIARCCGRGASNSGFEHLENLHQVLENAVSDRHTDRGNPLREILADSALAFAQELPDRKHLDYAFIMEAKFHRIQTRPRMSLTPRHTLDRSRIGFRWEEGISEWVMATPSMSTAKCKDKREFLRAEQSKCETPFRHPIQGRMEEEGTPPSTRVLRSYEPIDKPDISDELPMERPQSESSVVERRRGSPPETYELSSENELSNNREDSGDGQVYHALEDEPSNNLEDSGDELIGGALWVEPIKGFKGSADGQSNDVESADELQLSSPRSNSSDGSNEPGKPILDSSLRSENVFLNESFASVASPTVSHENRSGRRYIDRAPRLSRRVLRHNLEWQLFDESDDELSFMSVSSQEDSILQDATNKGCPTRRRLQTRPTRKQQRSSTNSSVSIGDSEDELCI